MRCGGSEWSQYEAFLDEPLSRHRYATSWSWDPESCDNSMDVLSIYMGSVQLAALHSGLADDCATSCVLRGTRGSTLQPLLDMEVCSANLSDCRHCQPSLWGSGFQDSMKSVLLSLSFVLSFAQAL